MLEDGRLALEHPDEYHRLWVEHQKLWANDLPSLLLFNWQMSAVTVTGLTDVQPSPFFSQGAEDTWNIFEWVWKLQQFKGDFEVSCRNYDWWKFLIYQDGTMHHCPKNIPLLALPMSHNT